MALKTPPHRLPSPRGRRGPSSPQGRVRPSLWVLTAGSLLGTAMLCYIYKAQAVSESSFSYKIPPIPSILVPESYMKLLCPSSLVNSEFSWGCVQEHGRGGYLQKNGNPQVGPSSKRCASSLVTINGLSILREGRTSSASSDPALSHSQERLWTLSCLQWVKQSCSDLKMATARSWPEDSTTSLSLHHWQAAESTYEDQQLTSEWASKSHMWGQLHAISINPLQRKAVC